MKRCAVVRVRYAETDQMGVAYYANYLTWFEVARTEFLRTSDFSYAEFEAGGVALPVVEASCRYRTPARYDDLLEIECRVDELTPARLSLFYIVRRGPEVLAEGRTVHAFLGPGRRPVNLKKSFPRHWAVLTALAAGDGGESTSD